jgi:hypothetical protein
VDQGKIFSQKPKNSGKGGGGTPSDIGPEFYAAERIASDALSKCGLLPERGI